jgi:hypothetical protein
VKRNLFLHKHGQTEPELIEVDESITVAELISRHGADGHNAWAQDGDELISAELVLAVVAERGHIHIGPHHEIEVTVRYETGDKTRAYKPGTRVKTVLDWARGEHGFNVPENQRAGLGLFLTGSTEPLDEAEHIGVVAGDSDDLRLILAPIKRPQG